MCAVDKMGGTRAEADVAWLDPVKPGGVDGGHVVRLCRRQDELAGHA